MVLIIIVSRISTSPMLSPRPESPSNRYMMKYRFIQRTIGQPKYMISSSSRSSPAFNDMPLHS